MVQTIISYVNRGMAPGKAIGLSGTEIGRTLALEYQKRWNIRNVGISETLEYQKRWNIRNVGISETLEYQKRWNIRNVFNDCIVVHVVYCTESVFICVSVAK